MPDPISSRNAVSAPVCDPTSSSCPEPEGAAAQCKAPPPAPNQSIAAPPHVVNLPPVVVTAQADLVKRYDQDLAGACRAQKNAIITGCGHILGAVLDHAIGAAFTNSVSCVELTKA